MPALLKPTIVTQHACARIDERTGLRPAQVQALLDNGLFSWARPPKPGEARFAVFFDTVLDWFAIAVIAPDAQTLTTVLTLEQFETTHGGVPAVLLQIAKLMWSQEQARREVLPTLVRPVPVRIAPPVWRFVAGMADGSWVPIGELPHAVLCAHALVPQTEAEFQRRAQRIVGSSTFLLWLQDSFSPYLDIADIAELRVAAVDPASLAVVWECDPTPALCEQLAASDEQFYATQISRRIPEAEHGGAGRYTAQQSFTAIPAPDADADVGVEAEALCA